MALLSLGGMNSLALGGVGAMGVFQRPIAVTNTTQDAANEATIMIGRIYWEDRGSHTVDTSGSSKLAFRTASVTFSNAGTTFKVGLAAVDLSNGPPARAANASDVISFDVQWSGAGGGGGITANAWQSKTPTSGSKTLAHGDFVAFATQMTARGGSDTIQTTTATGASSSVMPTVTSFTGAAYASVASLPMCVIIASDGTRGYIFGGCAMSAALSSAFASNSTPNERGNLFTLTVGARLIGVTANLTVTANCDLVLYGDPLGTPAALKTVSLDSNAVGNVSNAPLEELFSSPYDAVPGTYAIIAKPTTTTNVTLTGQTLADSNYQNANSLGTNSYAVNRSSGAFAQQNSGLDRYGIAVIADAFDSGGISRARLGLGH